MPVLYVVGTDVTVITVISEYKQLTWSAVSYIEKVITTVAYAFL